MSKVPAMGQPNRPIQPFGVGKCLVNGNSVASGAFNGPSGTKNASRKSSGKQIRKSGGKIYLVNKFVAVNV